MAAPVGSAFEPGTPRAVAVEAIASELAALWAAAPAAGDAAVTRACVLNLVAVAEGEPGDLDRRMASFPDLVARLTAEHPCRVFQVLAAPTGKDSLEAAVAAHCHAREGGSRQVCCEQITLRAAGAAAEHLHATIAPLLLGDLPTFLWLWDAPPFGSHRFERLARLADCVIVDTAHVEAGLELVADLAAWSRTGEGAAAGTAAGDLNWRRLWAWRDRVAALFDPPEQRRVLAELQQVTIRFPAGEAGAASRAVYLVGWLAGRLGWQVRPATARCHDAGLRVEMDAATHPVRIDLEQAGSGGDFAVCLQAADGDEAVVASVEEVADPASPVGAGTLSHIQCGGIEVQRRQAPLPSSSTPELLMRELELGSRDRVFDEALAVAGELARLWLPAEAE